MAYRRRTKWRYRDRSGWNEAVVRALYENYIAPNIDFSSDDGIDRAFNKPRQVLNETLQGMGYPPGSTRNRSNWTFWKYLSEIAEFVREDAQASLPTDVEEWRFRRDQRLPFDWKSKYLGGELKFTKQTLKVYLGDEGVDLWERRKEIVTKEKELEAARQAAQTQPSS